MSPPFLSVIVPVFGNPGYIEPCLSSIRESTFADYEILVADDGSPHGAAILETALRHNARVLRLEKNGGPATARNAAAQMASGEILVFLDSDVTVHRDTLAQIAEAFRRDPQLDALMGSYDTRPNVKGLVATFRNLLHAHVHQRSSREATTFWAGCGGVRRRRFQELGGFDEAYVQPSIEDVEFGIRLSKAGGRLALDPGIQVTHHKAWTFTSMVRTDAVLRAMPWTQLLLKHGLPRDLNFRWQDRISVLLGAVFPLAAFLALRFGRDWWAISGLILAAVAFLQLPLFRFLARTRSWMFSAACFPLYLVHVWAATAGLMLGLCRWELSRDRWLPWAAASLAVLIFGGVQAAGGAYTAEFDGYPDEAAHFMTGLMIRDYLVQWPHGNPVSWAEQYYVHYPKVAFGHWPPLFHLIEAAWWLFFPPSRVTGMLLVGLIGWIAAICFYRIARIIVHPAAALLASCLLVAAPVFQQAASQQMTELLTLVFGVLFLDAMVRFLRNGARSALAEGGIWCALGLFVKGTGACLAAALLFSLLPGGRWRSLRRRSLVWPIAAIAAGLLWYFSQGSWSTLAHWGDVHFSSPWSVAVILSLGGPGLVVLAVAAILTLLQIFEPVTAASAALALSVAGVSFFLRAMNEPRQFILALPALLLLSLACLRRLWEMLAGPKRVLAVGIAAAAALVWFPWSRYQQEPAGYLALARQIRQPARMLVSGTQSWAEGSWIVLASLREARPSSVIVRASKVLSKSSWNGRAYGLSVDSPAAVAATLDRLGIETVVLDEHLAGGEIVAHHKLLREALGASAAWKECGRSGSLFAYCRVQAAPVPREPLQLDLRRSAGRVILEK